MVEKWVIKYYLNCKTEDSIQEALQKLLGETGCRRNGGPEVMLNS